MNNKKAVLILNPKAGRQISERTARRISALLERDGYETVVCFTQCRLHATELVCEHAGEADIFVCCGGDGTLNETVAGLIRCSSDAPLGYVPLGTTNDFARTLKLSRTLDRAVGIITDGVVRQCDVGKIKDGMYFTYIASFGAFTSVSYGTTQDMKNKFGHAAYLMEGINSVRDIRPYHARVTADDFVTEGSFVFGSITNSLSVGGVLNFKSSDVDLNDGLHELLLIRYPDTLAELSDAVVGLMNKKYDDKNVILHHASHIELEFEDSAPFTADGEFAGDFHGITTDNIKGALNIFAPARRVKTMRNG